MAEAAGLALGILGLAGSFSSCIQALEMVQVASQQGEDLCKLDTKFENQKVRFLAWGRAVEEMSAMEALNHVFEEMYRIAVERTLQQIVQLFTVTENLTKKYGLRKVERSTHMRPSPAVIQDGRVQGLASLHHRILQASIWIVADRHRFTNLITDLKDFIDDLEMLTTRCFSGVPLLSRIYELSNHMDNRASLLQPEPKRTWIPSAGLPKHLCNVGCMHPTPWWNPYPRKLLEPVYKPGPREVVLSTHGFHHNDVYDLKPRFPKSSECWTKTSRSKGENVKAEATSNVYNCTRKLTGSVPEVDQEIGSVKLHAPDPCIPVDSYMLPNQDFKEHPNEATHTTIAELVPLHVCPTGRHRHCGPTRIFCAK